MRRVVLLLLVGASSGMMPGGEPLERVKRILGSPIIQRVAEELGLTLPDLDFSPLEQIKNNITNVDINELVAPAVANGCLPEGFAFDDATRDVVKSCISTSYSKTVTIRRPSGRRSSRGRSRGRGRSGGRRRFFGRRKRSIIERIKKAKTAQFMELAKDCIVEELNLLENGQLSQTSFDAVVDALVAPDEFKEAQKQVAQTCISETPSFPDDESIGEFQLRCIAMTDAAGCALGVAQRTSPTTGMLALKAAGGCFFKNGMVPSPRASMAMVACVAEGVSTFARGRLDDTAVALRRRRRDVGIMNVMNQLGDMKRIEALLGVAPPRSSCRRTMFRRCPSVPEVDPISEEDLDEVIGKIEEYVGPLGELFNSIPEKLGEAADCYYTAMNALNADGSVNIDAVNAIFAEFEGDEQIKAAATTVIEACDTEESRSSARAFQECVDAGAASACPLIELAAAAPPPPAL